MDLNIQIKYAGKTFRLHVKNLQDRFVLRGEKVMKLDQPISSFMNDSILSPLHFIDTRLNEFVNNVEKRFNKIINRIDQSKEN